MRSRPGNKYGQQADEHPRPHIDIPMSLFAEPLFSGRPDLVGKFAHHWCHCVWKKDPSFFFLELTQLEKEVAIETGFIVSDGDGFRLTGPNKDPDWLLDARKCWWTYAIRPEYQPKVKVGRSTNVQQRLAKLQEASPEQLCLLGKVKGDVERKVHLELRPYWLGGEWFELNEKSLSVLEARKLLS